MNTDRWREPYRAALLELRPEELRQNISVAEKVIRQRIAELSRDRCGFEEERCALDDAIRGLRMLAIECGPSASIGVHFSSSGKEAAL
jgi:hypothetical protein